MSNQEGAYDRFCSDGFRLPGAVGTLVVGANSVVIVKAYRKVEERRLAAKDLL